MSDIRTTNPQRDLAGEVVSPLAVSTPIPLESWIERRINRTDAVQSGYLRNIPETEMLKFYRVQADYGCFSNLNCAFRITVDGVRHRTCEHYYQASKYQLTDPEWAAHLLEQTKPTVVCQLGRDTSRNARKDWDMVKQDFMRYAVAHKIAQHSSVREALLATEERHIVEWTSNDNYWGSGKTKDGRNMLGNILMEIRDLLRVQDQYPGADLLKSYTATIQGRITSHNESLLAERV